MIAAFLVLLHFALLCPAFALFGQPQLGYNPCNWDCCSADMPSQAFMESTARSLVDRGFLAAGYEYLTIDDCYMTDSRDPVTHAQVVDPTKFPDGMPALAAFAHELGLQLGLYTAMGKHTCGGKMGSCGYFAVDAQQYAAWGADYLKLDNCGGCTQVLDDIATMQAALETTNTTFRLVVEGNPPVETVSANPHKYGNARRVGHDIYASWLSMISLVDVGSGLWPFAHNDTGLGGFFNDLDMMEIANGEFNETLDVGLVLNQAHFSLWVLMKAPILLGTVMSWMSDDLVSVLTNPRVLAIHQDPFGMQARRVASVAPPVPFNLSAPQDAVIALVPCDSNSVTQMWRINTTDGKLWTQDRFGQRWCVGPSDIVWGRPSSALPCDDPAYAYNASAYCNAPQVLCNFIAEWSVTNITNSSLVGLQSTTGSGTLSYDNTQYASGPLPHSRWMFPGGDLSDPTCQWQFDANAPNGSPLSPGANAPAIIDDNQIGNVTQSAPDGFCVDVVRAGNVEVWMAPLSNGQLAVGVFNRSPVSQPISVEWSALGLSEGTVATVEDVWEGKVLGQFSGKLPATPGPHAVLLYTLSLV